MYLRSLKYLPAMAILPVTIGGLVYAQAPGPIVTPLQRYYRDGILHPSDSIGLPDRGEAG